MQVCSCSDPFPHYFCQIYKIRQVRWRNRHGSLRLPVCHACAPVTYISIVDWAPRGFPRNLKNIYPPRGFFCLIAHSYYVRTVCDDPRGFPRNLKKYLPARRVFLFDSTRLSCLGRVQCLLLPFRLKYLPAGRVFLFDSTWLLCLGRVRCLFLRRHFKPFIKILVCPGFSVPPSKI